MALPCSPRTQISTLQRTPSAGYCLLVLCLVILGSGGFCPLLAQQPFVTVEITGNLSQNQRDNIAKHLSFNRLQNDRPLSQAMYQRLALKAKKEAAAALEPFGYYDASITLTKAREDDRWRITLHVDPGTPVRIEKVNVRIIGPGKDSVPLRQSADRFPLHPGDVLDHQLYEEGRDQLITAALNSGFLKASYHTSRVEVSRKMNRAAIELTLDTGPLHVFGPITFAADFIDHALLAKISPYREGDPFTPAALTRLRQSLFNADYFQNVDLAYDIEGAVAGVVPLKVILTPNLANKYGIGLGYGTDTGIRGTLEWNNRHINRYGHQIDVQLQPAERKSALGAVYTIPIGDPRSERLHILARYETETFDATNTTTWTSIVSLDRISDTEEYALDLQYLDERWEIDPESGHASLFIPALKATWILADDRITATRGIRLSASLAGSQEGVFADTSYLQATVHLKAIYSFFDRWRLIGRSDLGSTWTDAFDDIPPSLRFYAGGAQSVRGYGYKAIGPTNVFGHVIGGKELLVYSLELEYQLYDQWSTAFFYDSGGAMASLSDLTMKSGAGIGIRWNASFGQARLDLANALDEGLDAWRIHFTIGADL